MRSMIWVAAAAMLLLHSGAALAEAMRRDNQKIMFSDYPRGALKRGEEGTVGIRVVTDQQGRLRECAVTKSSGFAELDAASCDFLIRHARSKPYLAPNGGGVVRQQDGQVVWTLPPERKAALAREDKAQVKKANNKELARASEKLICRSQATTGSLIASQRICLTRTQWQQQYANAQDETQDMRPKFMPGN